MKLPEQILQKIIEISSEINKKELAQNFRNISDKYQDVKIGKSLLSKDNEAVAYAIARMPATYAAAKTAFIYTFERLTQNKQFLSLEDATLLDVGAGTGAAMLAFKEVMEENLYKINKITCLEREEAMQKIGKILLEEASVTAEWEFCDLQKQDINVDADIVITSYMLNEFSDENVVEIVGKLWDRTRKLFIFVDPGTPKDHQRLVKIKKYLVEKGGTVIAPCIYENGCPIKEDDWCHFVCRVERTKLQKDVKEAVVPYEDEKFTFLAVLKEPLEDNNEKIARIIRRPILKTNMIEVKLCLKFGCETRIYTKKQKEVYKFLKKAKVGDTLELEDEN